MTGSNLTITFTVEVNQLTGLKQYLIDYALLATVSASNGQAVVQKVTSNGRFLYSGSHWGPEAISVPINSTRFPVSSDNNLSAKITLEFIGDVQYDKPVNYHYTENNSTYIGNLTIVPMTASAAVNFISLIVLSGFVFAAVGLILWYAVKSSMRKKLRGK